MRRGLAESPRRPHILNKCFPILKVGIRVLARQHCSCLLAEARSNCPLHSSASLTSTVYNAKCRNCCRRHRSKELLNNSNGRHSKAGLHSNHEIAKGNSGRSRRCLFRMQVCFFDTDSYTIRDTHLLSGHLLRRISQGGSMKNHVEVAAETRVAIENHAGSVAETRKEWMAPKLKKVDIEEITANGLNVTPDGVLSS